MKALSVSALTVSYGVIRAVSELSLEVTEGETVALIGANGSGKTTTLKALMGLLPYSGEVRYQDQLLSAVPTHHIARRGMILVPEGRGVFTRLTVEENLLMGAYSRHDKAAIAEDLDKAFALFPRLKERRRQAAGLFSGGEQQMLAIARALMSRPKLLLLDEPSMGLSPLMVEKIFDTIRQIAAEGVSILLIEQNARMALEVSQRGYVLASGKLLLSGSGSELLGHDEVRQAYLGE